MFQLSSEERSVGLTASSCTKICYRQFSSNSSGSSGRYASRELLPRFLDSTERGHHCENPFRGSTRSGESISLENSRGSQVFSQNGRVYTKLATFVLSFPTLPNKKSSSTREMKKQSTNV